MDDLEFLIFRLVGNIFSFKYKGQLVLNKSQAHVFKIQDRIIYLSADCLMFVWVMQINVIPNEIFQNSPVTIYIR